MPKITEKPARKPRSKRKTVEVSASAQRKVIYPDLKGSVGWLTPEDARTFLGWRQSNTETPFTDYLFKDRNGVPTKCFNVEKQRPFYLPTALQWMGEILGGHWNGDGGEANGESMIIGHTGLVIDGKHRLIGLVLAEQEWLKTPERYPYWKDEPRIHCFINMGVREDIHSINTINTGKPRSLSDAIYACGLFGDLGGTPSSAKRLLKNLSRVTDYAVRMLWFRTGAVVNAFAPKRTHAESLDFIQRHPKILEAVRHIYEENGGKEDRLKYYPSPGYAAALLYLMGSSKTERSADNGYGMVDCPTEDLLDWSMWEKACDFWTKIAAKDRSMDPLRQAIADLIDSEGGSFLQERIAIIIKAWWAYAEGRKVTAKALELDTEQDADGVTRLAETPLIGEVFGAEYSIDIGGLRE